MSNTDDRPWMTVVVPKRDETVTEKASPKPTKAKGAQKK
jgi:hypothetical protein